MSPRPVGERVASIEATQHAILNRLDEDREEWREDRKAFEGYLRRIEETQKTEITLLAGKIAQIEQDRQRLLGMRDLVVTGVSVCAAVVAIMGSTVGRKLGL